MVAPSQAELGAGWQAVEGEPGGRTEADWDLSSAVLWMGGGSPPGVASRPVSLWTVCPWATRHLLCRSRTWDAGAQSAQAAS